MLIDFVDLFEFYHESDSKSFPNLTEENIYSHSIELKKNKEKAPVFSGATKNKGIIGYVPVYTKKNRKELKFKETFKGISYYVNKNGCITIVGDGKAGLMTHRPQKEYPLFCMTIHCIAIYLKDIKKIKEKYPNYDGLNLEWFTDKYSFLFQQLARGEGVPSFSKYLYKTFNLDIPAIKKQEKELKYFSQLNKIANICELFQKKYNILKKTHLSYKISNEEVLNNYLHYVSRNDYLTEEEIYRRSKFIKTSIKKIEVLSGSVKKRFGIIPFDEKVHHILSHPCIQVVRVGKAGSLKVLKKGNYAPNSNCMLIYIVKKKLKDLNIQNTDEEYAYLNYIASYLQPLFFEISTSADLSVFPLSQIIKILKMDFIPYSNEIKRKSNLFSEINTTSEKVNKIINVVYKIIQKDIIIN